jgi:molecular chaperone DnaK
MPGPTPRTTREARAGRRGEQRWPIYTTEKSLDSTAASSPGTWRSRRSPNLKDGDDPAKVKEALQRLEGSAYRIADAIYADQAKTSA